MAMCRIRQPRLLLVLMAIALNAIQSPLTAQPATPKSAIKVVLLSSGTSGLSMEQADSFFSSLREKLSQFITLSVSLKSDLARGLTKEERTALEKCSDVNCMQPLAAKAGFQRLLLCKLTVKNTAYLFQLSEFDVKRSQKLSEISDNAICTTTEQVESFIKKIAIKVGQTTAHETSVPESLQESKSNVWWYVGSAVTVGVAAGVYYLVSRPKESSTLPKSLPFPPDLP